MASFEGFDEIRLLIAPNDGLLGNGAGQFLSLRHPKSGNETCYLLSNDVLQEIHWFKQPFTSWFLGDYVTQGMSVSGCAHMNIMSGLLHLFSDLMIMLPCESFKLFLDADGRLYTATPVNPVFIFLPIFDEARMKKGDDLGRFRQLDEIMLIDDYPGYQHLLSVAENSMQLVCEVKGLTIQGSGLVVSQVLDAVSILSEYVKDDPWLKQLCSHLRLSLLELTRKASEFEFVPNVAGSNQGSMALQEKTKGGNKSTRAVEGKLRR